MLRVVLWTQSNRLYGLATDSRHKAPKDILAPFDKRPCFVTLSFLYFMQSKQWLRPIFAIRTNWRWRAQKYGYYHSASHIIIIITMWSIIIAVSVIISVNASKHSLAFHSTKNSFRNRACGYVLDIQRIHLHSNHSQRRAWTALPLVA